MVHMNQGPSSESWQVATPTMKVVKKMLISVSLQAKPRPWVPLMKTVNSITKGSKYLACRFPAHVAAGATIKQTM
eukprot:scaffold138721_cov133-Phaeocystis_antarctica.AAC.1